MLGKIRFRISATIFSTLIFFFISCIKEPISPFLLSNTKIFLAGKDSRGNTSVSMVDDSVGNTISIGFSSNLPEYLDSVQLKLFAIDTKDSMLKVFNNLKSLKYSDTSWISIAFSESGNKTIIGTAYVNNYAMTFSDTLSIIIHSRPLNHKPHIIVPTTISASPGNQCLLAITVNEPDSLQKDSIVLAKAPLNAFLNGAIFTWTPPLNFSGTDTAIFIAHDNGYPIMYDTAMVLISVGGSSINHAPHWQNKTITEVGTPGNAINLTLSDKCTDPDGDLLTFSLVTGISPSAGAITTSGDSSIYSFTPGPGDTGSFNPRVVAVDPLGLSDTMTINLSIHAIVIDSLPPAMTLMSPTKDSASASSNALAVKISCTDPSGVASVKCSIGADTFPIAHADSTYTAAISGLKQGVISTITFIAVDASSRANKGTLLVHVKYDSTLADNVPPTITLINPSKDTVIASDSSVVHVKCTDASGIASVVYTVGTQNFTATKSIPADSVYFATVKGLAGGTYSTVTITATDASPAKNVATATVKIKFDNDKTPPALKLLSPAKDSISLPGNATSIQVVCTDASGIASLTCNVGATLYPMAKSTTADSIWSGNITGLIAGQMTALTLIATDGSLSANKATLVMHIKYDPNMTDATGPTITKVSGLATGVRTANALDTFAYTVTDPSGVDTVSWTLNGASENALTAAANGRYSINAVLSAPHTNTIILIAYDKSPNHNKNVDTTVINYNRPPVVSGAHDTTIQTLSTLQFTVSAIDPEGDKVTLSAPTLPSGATFNASTGAFSWTPAATQSGANAATFMANDGLDTTTKTISVVVSNMPPPSITKNPAPDTACLGSPASFSITASGTGLTYQWQNAAGNLSGAHFSGITTNSLSINTITAGDSGVYSCLVTNAAGGIAASSGAKLTVNMPSGAPSAVNASKSSVCPGGSSALTETGGTLGAGAVWKWYTDTTAAALSATGASITVSPTAATTYYVRGEGTCGNTAFKSVTVNFNISSSPATSITANPSSVCLGVSSSLTENGGTLGAGALWKWYTDTTAAALSTTGVSIVVSPTTTTTYYVRAEGACGNTAFKNIIVGFNNSSTAATGVTANPTSVCPGGSTILTTSGGSLGTGASWKWYTNKTGTALTSNTVTPSATTWYFVRAEGTCGNSAWDSIQVIVNSAPIITTQPSPSSQSVWPGDSITFSIAATGSPTPTFKWQLNGVDCGVTTATCKIKNIATANAGNYTCIVSNTCGSVTSIPVALKVSTCIAVAAGVYHSLFLKNDSTLWACGRSIDSTPRQIMTHVKTMAADYTESVVIKNDGTVWYLSGNHSSSVQYPTVSNAKSVAAGGGHFLILQNDGKLFAVGGNGSGQLGDSTTNLAINPIAVHNGTNVYSIAASDGSSFMVKNDGSYWAWGENIYGQFGDGTNSVLDSVPTKISNVFAEVQTVAAGGNTTFLIKSDGELYASGDNQYGQYGNNAASSNTFQLIMNNVKNVFSGGLGGIYNSPFSLILESNGTLFGYGIGVGTIPPTQGIPNVVSASAGCSHCHIIKTDGTVWGYGSNYYSQLGTGTTVSSSTPVQIKF